ncbi:unnamed protein product [Sphenostylis stenocarpa]|uniref:Uncharacterized protein n=1 Tax=Sphenostylis stenocarpa TaxID=92480 RepID=A0AA86SC33_9FABA|nr:unnamed protein product [Sphenostylis stenocarpa]
MAPELTKTGKARTSTDVYGYGFLLGETILSPLPPEIHSEGPIPKHPYNFLLSPSSSMLSSSKYYSLTCFDEVVSPAETGMTS